MRQVLQSIPDGLVLKTDAFNEAEGLHPITEYLPPERAHIIELDMATVRKARKNCPGVTIQEGDIRRLPLEPMTFDLVIDLSTIDHIPDPHHAIREYARVLKPGGHLLLISWVYLGRGTQSRPSSYGGTQYFFDVRALRSFLQMNAFEITDGRIITPDLVDSYGGHDLVGADLHAYLCRRVA